MAKPETREERQQRLADEADWRERKIQEMERERAEARRRAEEDPRLPDEPDEGLGFDIAKNRNPHFGKPNANTGKARLWPRKR